MQNYERAISVVLHHEGGFTDNPNDRGGPTNFGITLKDWLAYYGREGTREEIRLLTVDMVKTIYKKLFWDHGFDQIESPDFATILFDQCVVSGMYGAVRRLQIMLGLTADGILGPKTLQKINEFYGKALSFQYVRASVHHYVALVESRPEQAEFLEGWINRLFSLLDFVFFDDVT